MAKKKIDKAENNNEQIQTVDLEKKSRPRIKRTRSNRYLSAKKLVDKTKFFSITEAINLVKKTSLSSFTGNLEVHAVVKQIGDCGEVKLPYFKGKTKKIVIADEKIVEQLKSGVVNFDLLLASPKIMPKLLPFARFLGPKGLMPNPKNGTLVDDPEKALSKLSNTSSLKVKTEKKAPLIHLVLGKLDQNNEELVANLEELIKSTNNTNQIIKMAIKSTMGPSVKIKV